MSAESKLESAITHLQTVKEELKFLRSELSKVEGEATAEQVNTFENVVSSIYAKVSHILDVADEEADD